MVTTICPECKHHLSVPDHYLGKWWRCPDCRTGFRAPLEDDDDRQPRSRFEPRRPPAREPGAVSRALSRFVSMLTGR